MQKQTKPALLPGWPDSKTPTFVHWALTEGYRRAWDRTRRNPICRCLAAKVPIYTGTSVPLSEAAGGGWGESCRTQQTQKHATPGADFLFHHMVHARLLLPDMFCVPLIA